MSEHLDDNSLSDSHLSAEHVSSGDTEEVDALVVLSEVQIASSERPGPPVRSTLAAGQVALTAAVAATGFAAGAAIVSLAHRRGQSPARSRNRRLRGRTDHPGVLEIVGSRSFLVDVHLLGGSGRNR